MSYTQEELKQRLMGMYPEIARYGLKLELALDQAKDAWVVTFRKGDHQRHAFLDRKDADACIEGNACIYLGMLITQYVKDLERAPRRLTAPLDFRLSNFLYSPAADMISGTSSSRPMAMMCTPWHIRSSRIRRIIRPAISMPF